MRADRALTVQALPLICSTFSSRLLNAGLPDYDSRATPWRKTQWPFIAEDGFLGLLLFSYSMPLGCSIAQAKHFYMCVTFSICLGSEIDPFRK